MKLFCTGDLHIGRRSSHLPDTEQHSCADAWLRAADTAIYETADVVLLSGDIINKDNQFFEAAGPLEAGIQKLIERKIHVCAVAGNHDYRALTQFLHGIQGDYLHLLGVDGKWDSVIIEHGGQKLRVVGWSFPSEHVQANPLESFPDTGASDIPTMGLVHCDIDSSGSKYAPVPLGDLKSQHNICFWLTGHIHIPNAYNDTHPLVLNPGSLQAMDPGETGDHGPWIVEINGGVVSQPQQLKTSTVKYCKFDIDVTDWEIDDIKRNIIDEVYDQSQSALLDNDAKIVSARVNITGSTSLQTEMKSQLANTDELKGDGFHIDQINFAITPPIDIELLAAGKGAAAIAARILLSIDAGTLKQEHAKLYEDAKAQMDKAYDANGYELILQNKTDSSEDVAPDEDCVLAALKSQCQRLIGEMVEGSQAK
ncbi:MAG: DNA repair exonuclease [Armatimonadetes bacterium]|nr:DNA repair exonuclease [Armatimonadota bacterium]